MNGASKIFTLKADISSAAETGKTIVFVDTNADLFVTSDAYGLDCLAILLIMIVLLPARPRLLTIKGGSVTIAIVSAPAHDVKTDSTGVELASNYYGQS